MVKQDYSIAISETIHVIVVSLLRGSWPFKLLHPSSIHIPYDGLKTPVLLRRGPVRGEVVVQPWFIMKVSKSKITCSCGHMKTSSMCFVAYQAFLCIHVASRSEICCFSCAQNCRSLAIFILMFVCEHLV